VLKSANQNSRYCYKQALSAAARARIAKSSRQRRLYLDMEEKWLRRAASYEHAEGLAAVVDELHGLHKRPFCSVCDAPMRPIGLQCRGDGLVEFLFKCVTCDESLVQMERTKSS
jgi:hypothetical protein